METKKVHRLLSDLLNETQDALVKQKLEAIIIELDLFIHLASVEDKGDDKKGAPSNKQDHKITWKIADAIGKFFTQVASKIIADEIMDNL